MLPELASQTKTITTVANGWNVDGIDNIMSLSSSISQTPNAGPNKYFHSNSVVKGVKFSNLQVTSSTATYNWNGFSTIDPITGGVPCRLPNTTAIVTTGSSTAGTNSLQVDITAK